MPLYEYRCDACGHQFEVIQRFADPPVASCQNCGGAVRKLLSPSSIQFKGTGWYVTDYARKGAAEPSASPKPSAAASPSPSADSAPPKTDGGGTSSSGGTS